MMLTGPAEGWPTEQTRIVDSHGMVAAPCGGFTHCDAPWGTKLIVACAITARKVFPGRPFVHVLQEDISPSCALPRNPRRTFPKGCTSKSMGIPKSMCTSDAEILPALCAGCQTGLVALQNIRSLHTEDAIAPVRSKAANRRRRRGTDNRFLRCRSSRTLHIHTSRS